MGRRAGRILGALAALYLLGLVLAGAACGFKPRRPQPRALPEPENNAPIGRAVRTVPRATGHSSLARAWTESDEFTGRTTHRFEARLDFGAEASIFSINGSPLIRMIIHTYSDRWQFLECHHVNALADDVRIAPAGTDHEGSVLRRGVTEHVSFGLSMQELHAMAAAERVRVRVCTRVFTLPPGSNAALRDLYTAIYRGIGGAADAATTTPDAGQ